MPPPSFAKRRDGDFLRVLCAEGVSNFGSMLSRLAIPWIAVLVLDATPLQMGWLLVADVLAGAVGALWLGGMVDRHGKRSAMLASDGLRAAVLLLLAVLAFTGRLSLAVLLVAAAANGLLTVCFELARSAWVAQRTAAVADLPRCNAQLSVVGSLSETAAFALGGWLFQALGAVVALALDALSYLLSALCLRSLAEPPRALPQQQARQSAALVWHDMAAGVQAVAASPVLRALAAVQVLLALSMSLTGVAYMVFAVRDVGFQTGPLGTIAALGGLGAVLGAALAPAVGRALGSGWAMALGLALFALGAACIPLAVAPGWAGAALLAAHQIVGDGGHTLHDVHDRSLRQSAVGPDLLARADAGIRTAGQLAALAGALGGGAFASAVGVRSALVLAAAIAGAAAVLAAVTLTGQRVRRTV